MSLIKSKEENIYVYLDRTERCFEKALNRAMEESLKKLEVDDSGHNKYKDKFPRSESSIKIEFVGMTIAMGMGGHSFEYEFKTWIEKESEDDD